MMLLPTYAIEGYIYQRCRYLNVIYVKGLNTSLVKSTLLSEVYLTRIHEGSLERIPK